MYLIDKVVRAKSLIGPIGIDNSEVINIELERELKKRNRYLANLAERKPQKIIDEDGNEIEVDVDEDELNLTPEERENIANEKLL